MDVLTEVLLVAGAFAGIVVVGLVGGVALLVFVEKTTPWLVKKGWVK